MSMCGWHWWWQALPCGSARELLPPRGALLAALLYATNPYLMINAYKRCAFAELLASALFPVLVWGVIRMGKDARTAALPLSLVLAAMWLSDLPVAVIASYSLAGLLVLCSLLYRTFRPILYGSLAILAGIGASAFFCAGGVGAPMGQHQQGDAVPMAART